MADLITKHCSEIEKTDINQLTPEKWNAVFKDWIDGFRQLQSSGSDSMSVYIDRVAKILQHRNYMIDNVLIEIIHEHYSSLMKIWRQQGKFEREIDKTCFENIPDIIMTNNYGLTTSSIKHELSECLNAIASNGEKMFNNSWITVIKKILDVFTNVLSRNLYYFMEPSELDKCVMECLCASYTPIIFSQFISNIKSVERSKSEDFVFNGLIKYLDRINRGVLGQWANPLRQQFIPLIFNILEEFLNSHRDWPIENINILSSLTTTFIYSVQISIVDSIHLEIQVGLVDKTLGILRLGDINPRLAKDCIQYLYNATFNDKTLERLVSLNIVSDLFGFIETFSEDDEIQFNCYRILAALMTEEDIKQLKDPGFITKVFLSELERVSNKSGWEVRVKNILVTLKILLQHDQIRDEVIKQSGVSLFVSCAMKERFESAVHQRALENLLIMAFDDKVCEDLKSNTSFMEHLQTISKSSTDADLQHAADSLQWYFTKDDSVKSESADGACVSGTEKYDIMISYSHKDKDLCFQLYDRLSADNFRVWLDRDQMHGTPLEAMSQAIENSEFVFLCMSDSYKQSGYCKMEAYYALDRACTIIPLVMKSHFKPDGWLGIMTTGRIRIDFPKYGFDEAYKKLLIEIQRTRREKRGKQLSSHHEVPTSNETELQLEQKPKQSKLQLPTLKTNHSLPQVIEKWSNDDVQQFFLQKHLEVFLWVCSAMNGERLLSMIRMCLSNPPLMLDRLNQEISNKSEDSKENLIEITQFLQFLEDVKPFIAIPVEQLTIGTPQSAVCSIM